MPFNSNRQEQSVAIITSYCVKLKQKPFSCVSPLHFCNRGNNWEKTYIQVEGSPPFLGKHIWKTTDFIGGICSKPEPTESTTTKRLTKTTTAPHTFRARVVLHRHLHLSIIILHFCRTLYYWSSSSIHLHHRLVTRVSHVARSNLSLNSAAHTRESDRVTVV